MYAAAEAGNPGSQGFIRAAAPFTRLLYPAGGGDLGLFGDSYQSMAELEYSPTRAFALRLQYSGGQIFDRRFDVFGANLELALSPQFAVFGRYGLGSYDDTAFGDVEPNYWMAGVALRDLLKPGALAGIAAGQPFIEGAVGNATQTNFEAFYNFPLTNNITVTPLVQVITNAAIRTATARFLQEPSELSFPSNSPSKLIAKGRGQKEEGKRLTSQGFYFS